MNPALVQISTPEIRSLLDRARAGDGEAFGELCRVHETRLLRQAMTLCGNETLAEELAQDSLVEAWKCLRRYDGRCQFFTWLCAILLNRYRNSLRKKHLRPMAAFASSDREVIEDRINRLPDGDLPPDELAQQRERSAQVRACLDRLPAKHQQVVYLRFYVDTSLEGIAAALGCTVGTVKSRLFNALEKLRQMNALNPQSANLGTNNKIA